MQVFAPFDNQEIFARIFLVQCVQQIEILNGLILKGNIFVKTSFEHHRTVVYMLHPTFFCKINELPKDNSTFNQNCIDRLLILLIVLKN